MNKEAFEKVVEKAVDSLPEELASKLSNIEIIIEDSPRAGKRKNSVLLGLYEGVPLEERGTYYAGALPDKITLFQKNIEAICHSEAEMVDQIQRTILHEIGHYFGISEKRLRELGY